MKKMFELLAVLLFLTMTVSIAAAVELNRVDWAFNVDGTTYEDYLGDAMPGSNNFDASGLGTLELTVNGAGDHYVLGFFDFEIDERFNTFYNESGDAHNTPAVGQSAEIDEPGYVFGDIYFNLLDGALDNTIAVPAGAEDDVSFALGWNFSLAADKTATLTFTLTDIAPTSGIFYLSQTDADSQYSLYYYSELQIGGGGQAIVPEPSTYLLFAVGLAGLGIYRRRSGK